MRSKRKKHQVQETKSTSSKRDGKRRKNARHKEPKKTKPMKKDVSNVKTRDNQSSTHYRVAKKDPRSGLNMAEIKPKIKINGWKKDRIGSSAPQDQTIYSSTVHKRTEAIAKNA